MPVHRLALGFAGALLALGIGTTAATAATAFASTSVNVRAGAGTGYPVVDVLRPGQRVEVDYCRGTWCKVEKSGPDGWVNANYLTARYADDDDYYYDDDDFFIERPRYRPFYPRYRSQVCWGGKNASFCFSD
jgi:uncharacterized protein YraI